MTGRVPLRMPRHPAGETGPDMDTPAAAPLPVADPEQLFVSRLRSAARGFASAAGAQTAVVREAVPPARHRRSRCRVVLRWADGAESDVTFLGPAGRSPGVPTSPDLDVQIRRWLTEGRPEDPSWLVPDEDSPAGTAVDVAAWLAR